MLETKLLLRMVRFVISIQYNRYQCGVGVTEKILASVIYKYDDDAKEEIHGNGYIAQ